MIKTNLRPSDVFGVRLSIILFAVMYVVPIMLGLLCIAVGIIKGNFETIAGGFILLGFGLCSL